MAEFIDAGGGLVASGDLRNPPPISLEPGSYLLRIHLPVSIDWGAQILAGMLAEVAEGFGFRNVWAQVSGNLIEIGFEV